jgi:hypothetical protein
MMAKTMERSRTDEPSFPQMGESAIHGLLNLSGRPSAYTTSTPKKTRGRGASPTGTAGHRGSTLINEANGPSCHVTATLYKSNAAEAGMQTRNVKILKSAVGVRDFRSRDAYKQGV